jgi:hypothetical protein
VVFSTILLKISMSVGFDCIDGPLSQCFPQSLKKCFFRSWTRSQLSIIYYCIGNEHLSESWWCEKGLGHSSCAETCSMCWNFRYEALTISEMSYLARSFNYEHRHKCLRTIPHVTSAGFNDEYYKACFYTLDMRMGDAYEKLLEKICDYRFVSKVLIDNDMVSQQCVSDGNLQSCVEDEVYKLEGDSEVDNKVSVTEAFHSVQHDVVGLDNGELQPVSVECGSVDLVEAIVHTKDPDGDDSLFDEPVAVLKDPLMCDTSDADILTYIARVSHLPRGVIEDSVVDHYFSRYLHVFKKDTLPFNARFELFSPSIRENYRLVMMEISTFLKVFSRDCPYKCVGLNHALVLAKRRCSSFLFRPGDFVCYVDLAILDPALKLFKGSCNDDMSARCLSSMKDFCHIGNLDLKDLGDKRLASRFVAQLRCFCVDEASIFQKLKWICPELSFRGVKNYDRVCYVNSWIYNHIRNLKRAKKRYKCKVVQKDFGPII